MMRKLNRIFSKILCHIFIFLLSGTVYYGMEILFKKSHTSHWSMFLLAGFAGLFFIDGLNDLFSFEMDYLLQILICTIAITAGEYVVSITLNQNYTIWDYRNMPFNIGGQVCLPFCFIWMFLSAIFIPFLDWVEWAIFDHKQSEKPYYKIFGKTVFTFK